MRAATEVLAFVAATAAAISGIIYLVSKFSKTWEALANLAEIGREDKWPNGSKDLPSSVNRIYEMVKDTNRRLDEALKDHRETHRRLDERMAGWWS